MKKVLFGFLGILMWNGVASADTFGAMQLTPDLNFKAQMGENGSVTTSWDAWQNDFMWYKVSRSQSNANPVYPEDGAVFWSDDVNETTYFDPDPPHGKTFYRVCAITHAKERFCSNVVAIENNPETNTSVSVSAEASAEAEFCDQVITPAINLETNECHEFATPCDVPDGWQKVNSCPEVDTGPKSITLSAELVDYRVALSWETTGTLSENGFQLLRAKSVEPSFPSAEGDLPSVWIDATASSYTDQNTKTGEKYFYQICEYKGQDECDTFSNVVSVEIPVTDVVDTLKKTFSDVDETTEMGSAIIKFAKKGVVNGFEDGTFQSDKAVTRAELAKMATLALGKNPTTPETAIFCDVPVTEWFAPFVHFFAENKYAKGFENDECELGKTFAPHNPVKRNEAIKMILEITGKGVEEDAEDWFKNYFDAAVEAGIITEERADFGEMSAASRGEIMLYLDRATK